MKKCLNCKYEPKWSVPTKGPEYIRQWGMCLWPETHIIPVLPSVYHIHADGITRFLKDDSGVKTNCPTWEPKS